MEENKTGSAPICACEIQNEVSQYCYRFALYATRLVVEEINPAIKSETRKIYPISKMSKVEYQVIKYSTPNQHILRINGDQLNLGSASFALLPLLSTLEEML